MLKDKDIREPLFDFLEETYGKIRILEEKTMGRSRADAVMVTENALYGIEIKSDADTYARLQRQVKDYDLYYDFNYAVVGTSHALHVGEHLPDWWGIITAELEEGRVDFYILRKPLPNPGVNRSRQLSLLWRTELLQIQEQNRLPLYREKSKLFVQIMCRIRFCSIRSAGRCLSGIIRSYRNRSRHSGHRKQKAAEPGMFESPGRTGKPAV